MQSHFVDTQSIVLVGVYVLFGSIMACRSSGWVPFANIEFWLAACSIIVPFESRCGIEEPAINVDYGSVRGA